MGWVQAGLLAIWDLVVHQRRPQDVLVFSKWRDDMYARLLQRMGKPLSTSFTLFHSLRIPRHIPSCLRALVIAPQMTIEQRASSPVASLVAKASGVILDLGPGTGSQLPLLDASKITKVYGIELNTKLFPDLRRNIKKAGLEDVYTIVPCGVENVQILKEYGITENSVDSIIALRVLCSVPNPEQTLSSLYRMLKPGGQMIVYEHVKHRKIMPMLYQGLPSSKHQRSNYLLKQYVLDLLSTVWPTMIGCELDRSTGQTLERVGKWSQIELKESGFDSNILVFPHVYGRLVK